MTPAVRQRVPFRFSEDDDLDGHVLDEQEQEEVLDRLRKQNQNSNAVYYTGLQFVVSLSLLIHAVFTFSSTKISPLAPLFPDSPSKPVPFTNALLLLQYMVHGNLILYCLPRKHHMRQMIPNASLPRSFSLPLPLSHPAAIVLPLIAPAYATFLGRGIVDVLWWSAAGILSLVVGLATKWMRDAEKDVEELDKLRYTARGA
ncbi:hypothetical protein BD311DRAFT_722194 [Dichomitus squalens]|uniref:Uncharacterized protein n=1 Tax=Dichomitus squalens TaxID=114155 RepID=A0A4Q9MLW2_9APHY|nr:hypothetical protein BD311DRAFT_722194 [Dichomitus squalens]